jgi:hypothetical protein
VGTLEECMKKCDEVAECVAWAFGSEASKDTYHKCYLKSSRGTEGADNTAITGYCDSTQRKITHFYVLKYFNVNRFNFGLLTNILIV